MFLKYKCQRPGYNICNSTGKAAASGTAYPVLDSGVGRKNKTVQGGLQLKIPSLTVSKRQNSCKSRIYGLCGCLFVCIDVCYIFVFVLVVFFVFEIIPRMEAFDINSKSVLNPNEL